jgi:hypothetical protein
MGEQRMEKRLNPGFMAGIVGGAIGTSMVFCGGLLRQQDGTGRVGTDCCSIPLKSHSIHARIIFVTYWCYISYKVLKILLQIESQSPILLQRQIVRNGHELQTITRFYIVPHAIRRKEERGIDIEAMKNVVKYAQKRTFQYKGEHGGNVYRMSKPLGAQWLTVAAEIKGSECWIITGFYE